VLRVQSANPSPPKKVRLVRTGVNAVGVVKDLADLDAAIDQFAAPGAAEVTFLPKITAQPELGGVNWITRK
jgi:hypothetical protein